MQNILVTQDPHTMTTGHKSQMPSRQYLYYQGPDFCKVSEMVCPKETFESKPEFDSKDFDSIINHHTTIKKSPSLTLEL